MELDLSLDALKFANVSDFNRAYGDKVLSNGGSLTTKQFNEDVAKIFDTQRPIEVTEDSTTGTVEYNANIVMNSATAITLSLGNGTYVGCKVSVLNISNVIHKVVIDTNTYSLLSDIAKEFVWNGSAWIQKSVIIDTNPSGTIISFAGTTAPAGYIQCDGRAISRTDYSQLFNAIGTTYGEGDGSTTFNVPKCNQKPTVNVELMTGERWFDGKPVYQVILTQSMAITSSNNILNSSNQNLLKKVDSIVNANLISRYNNEKAKTPVFFSYSTGDDRGWYFETSWASGAVNNRYIIITYTKTTDTASSPCYNQIASEGIFCIKAV